MIPRKKAQELANYYMPFCKNNYNDAKQCALIAVYEILRHTYIGKAKSKNDDNSFEYWQEVKKEIEKL